MQKVVTIKLLARAPMRKVLRILLEILMMLRKDEQPMLKDTQPLLVVTSLMQKAIILKHQEKIPMLKELTR
jgi:hypothetical protein